MQGFSTLLTVFVYAAGGVVCHQLADRSFYWGDVRFPVCARCTGLYVSGAVGAVAWLLVRLRRRAPIDPKVAVAALLLAAVPTGVSLVSGWVGAWDGTNLWRAWLAVPLGGTAGALVAAVAARDLR